MQTLFFPIRKDSTTTRRSNAGFTLVELLIVIVIMLVLVGVAIPTIRTLTKGDTVREATRELNLFIESARSDAINSGFAGIWLERDRDPNKVTRIFKVKRPPRYAGDFEDVKAYVRPKYNGANYDLNRFDLYFIQSENTLFATTAGPNGQPRIRLNDRIQIGGRGPWYQILTDPVTDTLNPGESNDPSFLGTPLYRVEAALNTLTFDSSNSYSAPLPSLNNYLVPIEGSSTFLIERAPKISSRDFLQLPKGTYLNLMDSGFAVDPSVDLTLLVDGERLGGNEFASNDTILEKFFPIVMTFRKDGSVDRVDYQVYPTAATDPAFFTPASEFPRTNLFFHVASESETLDVNHDPLDDLQNFWIVISRSNGTVMTASSLSAGTPATDAEKRANSRRGARDGQNQDAN